MTGVQTCALPICFPVTIGGVGCRLERSRQWAVRCMHEASMHMFNSFVTLTYDDDHLPEYNSLNYKHFQDFMKRCGNPIMVFDFICAVSMVKIFRVLIIMLFCLIVFFPDRKKHSTGDSGSVIYTSEALTKLWPFGFPVTIVW